MQFLIVLAAAVACAAADVSHILKSEEYAVPIVRSNYDITPDGNFQYGYETGNGIVAEAAGTVTNSNTDEAAVEIRGSYAYTAPDGTPVKVSYIADKEGFRAESDQIPVAPPVPEAILRSLAYIEANRPYVEANKPYVEANKPVYKP